MRKYRLGYVDENEDDGAVFYDFVEQHIDTFEFKYFCPVNGQDIDDLYNEIKDENLDILIIDYRLNEYAAIDFKGTNLIDYIRMRRRDFPCILLTSHPDEAIDDFSDAHLVYHKNMIIPPDDSDKTNPSNDSKTSSQNIFYKIIISSIDKYIRNLENASSRIFELNKKSALTLEEEQEYIVHDEFIENNTDGLHHVPRQIKAKTHADQVNNILKDTNELLEKLRIYNASIKK